MGGGPEKEHLLITLHIPDATLQPQLQRLRTNHPNLQITTYSTLPSLTSAPNNNIPAHLYANATILLTLSALPPAHLTPSLAYPHLRLVHFFSAGLNPAVSSHPLYTSTIATLTTSSGIAAPQIAVWVVLSELAQRRKYDDLRARQRARHWGADGLDLGDVSDGVGKTVGVLGYGGIGRQVGRVLSGMGWRVVAYTASKRDTVEKRRERGKFMVRGTGDVEGRVPVAWYFGTERGDVQRFLEAKGEGGLDWLVVCVPLTAGTRGLLGKDELELLGEGEKKGTCFVTNISRGPVIDTDALIKALEKPEGNESALLRGAALDVTDPEPLPKDSPLWEMENVTITPHISGLGKGYTGRSFEILDENLGRLRKGKDLLNVVSRRKGY